MAHAWNAKDSGSILSTKKVKELKENDGCCIQSI
jgi:hypothetical protein